MLSIIQLRTFSLLSKHVKFKYKKKYFFPVVFYGYETWPLTLWDEHRLKVFHNRVMRKISGSKKDEIIGGWEKITQRVAVADMAVSVQ
jgi:hypothetical protein